MQSLKTIHISIEEESTAIVTINRPDALNALNQLVLAELDNSLTEIANNASIKGVIITGAGNKAFVAGADISEINLLTEEQALKMAQRGQALFHRIEQFHKPVIAYINGFALGGGCELAMACHLRTAAKNAKLGQPEINLGLIPGYGGTQRLTKLIGRTRALSLLLTGDPINAETALQYGLVNHVFDPEEGLAQTKMLLNKICQKSSKAIRFIIDAVNALDDNHQQDGYTVEAELFAQSVASHDGKEGTSAFLEKRKPNFTGN